MHTGLRRWLHTTSRLRHENPLGLPRSRDRSAPPQLPRRSQSPLQKRSIPHAKRVLAVSSGKGGVGKSTVAVNLAFALASTRPRARVGILDLDVFGPSIPKLMGLEGFGEPDLTQTGALVPLTNYNIPCMSMGFLLPPSASNDSPVVWRGLMVQKAVQQLLFDVDWQQRTGRQSTSAPENLGDLDVLVIDMPPGTGDVQLTLGQLVKVDGTVLPGAVIVSTPQDIALLDARKGVHMFRKVGVPILGLLVNSAYYRCTSCQDKHYIFGTLDSAKRAVNELGSDPAGSKGLAILGEIPLVADVSRLGDEGRLGDLFASPQVDDDAKAEPPEQQELLEVRRVMECVAEGVWGTLAAREHHDESTS